MRNSYFLNHELSRYPNLHEVRLIPTKKDIAFVEYMDEGSATIAKDALHNYKLDGENKIKVSFSHHASLRFIADLLFTDHICKEVVYIHFIIRTLIICYRVLYIPLYCAILS